MTRSTNTSAKHYPKKTNGPKRFVFDSESKDSRRLFQQPWGQPPGGLKASSLHTARIREHSESFGF